MYPFQGELVNHVLGERSEKTKIASTKPHRAYNDEWPADGVVRLATDGIMLEHRVLLVRSGTKLAVQLIVDGDSGAALGYARWQPEQSSWWRRALGRGTLAVYEQEDEPLLFTIRRSWSLLPSRQVNDAEGEPVGTLLGRFIYDRYDRPVASLDKGVFRGPDQRVLAELNPTTEGQRLTFSDDVAGEPFVKMLLLAAALQMTR